jgi:hypothetical protein
MLIGHKVATNDSIKCVRQQQNKSVEFGAYTGYLVRPECLKFLVMNRTYEIHLSLKATYDWNAFLYRRMRNTWSFAATYNWRTCLSSCLMPLYHNENGDFAQAEEACSSAMFMLKHPSMHWTQLYSSAWLRSPIAIDSNILPHDFWWDLRFY